MTKLHYLVLLLSLQTLVAPAIVQAADPTFVGVLALAVEEEGVRRLGLDDETRQSLLDVIDRREQQALGLALDIKDLPPDAIQERLAPFVAASEREGLALLTVEQRSILQQMAIAHRGMASLADPELARMLDLTDSQLASVNRLLDQREQAVTRGGATQRRMAVDRFEREVKRLLTPQQRANWEQLAGLTAAGDTADVAETQRLEPPVEANNAESNDDAIIRSDAKLRFNFQHAAWSDVLEWFAEQADLSLQLDAPPKGTFNYRDTRRYTPAEALDLMNGFLLFRGHTLVRRGRLLTLLNVEDEIPPQFVELVSIDELDSRGEFTLLKCLFKLGRLSAEDAKAEIEPLLGPQGEIVALAKSGQIMVTETGGKLRTIRSVIESIESPGAGYHDSVVDIPLRFVAPEDVLAVARPLLGLEEGENVSEDDADMPIRLAIDPFSARIFASGDRAAIQRLQEIVPLIDRSLTASDQPVGALQQPQLAAYPISQADPNQVKQVLETLLQGLPDVHMAIDPLTNKLILLARPGEHQTVIATLRQLEGEAEQIEVISLRRWDPQLVIQAINQLFGEAGDDEESTKPKVTGDPTTRKLWVRGTAPQIAQIKDLVAKLEGPDDGLAAGPRQNIRMLPFGGNAAQTALENIEAIWPLMRTNNIRIVTPSAVGSTMRERRPAAGTEPREQRGLDAGQRRRRPESLRPRRPAGNPSTGAPSTRTPNTSAPNASAAPSASTDDGGAGPDETARLVSWLGDDETAAAPDEASPSDLTPEPSAPAGKADIVITMTPSGLLIASEDLDALDDFEQLLRSVMADNGSGLVNEPTVFWLKYAKADVAAEIVRQVLTGTTSTPTTSVLGEVGGELLGGLLGIGGAGSVVATGSATIVPNIRLNALIVQAPPGDLALIERILPVIDRESGPEDVETAGKPRLIPVNFMAAEDMSTILKQVYVDKISGAGGGQQQQRQRQQPNPADFFRQAFGRGRGGGSSGGQAQQEPPKMTIGVDARSNSLIVTASEPLFREVEALVAQLDQQGMETDDAVSVVTIRQANPELIQRALQSIVGEAVSTTGSTSSNGSNTPGSSSSTAGTAAARARATGDAAAAQRRAEFFCALRSGGGGGRGGATGGRGGGGFGAGGGRGGFGGGGRGGFGGGRGGGGGGGGGGRGR